MRWRDIEGSRKPPAVCRRSSEEIKKSNHRRKTNEKNKKAVAIIAGLAATIAATVTAGAATNGIPWGVRQYNGHQLYAATMRVCATDGEADIVTLEDSNGFTWEISGVDDWTVGDFANVIFDDCGTQQIFDDVVLSAKYENLTRWID